MALEQGEVRHSWLPHHWQVWSLPAHLLSLILFVDIVVFAWVADITASHVDRSDLLRFVLLVGLGLASVEVSGLLSRQRILFADAAPYTDLSTVWLLAGSLILPLNLTVTLVLLSRFYYSRRVVASVASSHLYREVYSASANILSCLLTGGIITLLVPHHSTLPKGVLAACGVAAALVIYYISSLALILLAVLLAGRRRALRSVLPPGEQLLLEATSVLLAAVTAVLAVHQPWLVVALPPILLVIERASHTQHFQRAASLDTKTGLLNATAWQILATRELVSTAEDQECAAVLIVDLDHFKRINDSFGHLAGDRVLADVADTLTAELRGYDLIGRFGGEEFVAFLPGATAEEAAEIAERARRRIRKIQISAVQRDGAADVSQVTASIGVAAYPQHGHELSTLLQEADLALYHAKEAGRDGVQTATPLDAVG